MIFMLPIQLGEFFPPRLEFKFQPTSFYSRKRLGGTHLIPERRRKREELKQGMSGLGGGINGLCVKVCMWMCGWGLFSRTLDYVSRSRGYYESCTIAQEENKGKDDSWVGDSARKMGRERDPGKILLHLMLS